MTAAAPDNDINTASFTVSDTFTQVVMNAGIGVEWDNITLDVMLLGTDNSGDFIDGDDRSKVNLDEIFVGATWYPNGR